MEITDITNITGITSSFLGGGGIPVPASALFHLDGSISGSEFVDISGNGRNFTITNKDFTGSGFPYKSAATISAPAADATLIAADINFFWYAETTETPNEIPVVSLFQNQDYGDINFCRHISQAVDGNGVETLEPYVKDIVLYDAALTGGDLTGANSYYGVPTEQTINVQWVGKDGNDTTGDGSKALPWLTIVKGHTEAAGTDRVYITTGQYTEKIADALAVNIYGLGAVEMNPADYCARQTADTAFVATHIYFNSNAAICLRSNVALTANWDFDKCKISGTTRALYAPVASTNILSVDNCILVGRIDYRADTSLDTTLFYSSPVTPISLYGNDFTSVNSVYNVGVGTAGIIILISTGFTISFLGDTINTFLLVNDVKALDGTLTLDYCTITAINGIVQALSNHTGEITTTITNNSFISNGTSATLIGIDNQSGDVVMNDNTFTNVNGLISAIGVGLAQTFECKRNVATSITGETVTFVSGSMVADIQDNIMVGGAAGIVVYNDLASAQVSIIKGNVLNTIDASQAIPFIKVGVEDDVSTYGKSDGTVISENVCYGSRYYGEAVGGHHGIFSYAQNIEIKYNRVLGTFLAFVIKQEGLSYVAKLHHNIIIDCTSAWTIKGSLDTLIYNDTCVNTSDSVGVTIMALQHIIDTDHGSVESTGLMFKNNIMADFRDVDSEFITSESVNLVGSEFDYNIYYKVNAGTLFAVYDSPATKTFIQWQALTQDVNSTQVDPLFTDIVTFDLSLGAGSPAIDEGDTLAAAYDDSLDSSTDWGDTSTLPTVVTKQQTAPWDIGAYVS